jgi:hypothetical protein
VDVRSRVRLWSMTIASGLQSLTQVDAEVDATTLRDAILGLHHIAVAFDALRRRLNPDSKA